jgi:hypothetical protein
MPSTAPPGLPFGIGTYAIKLRGRRPRLKRHGAARCSLTLRPRDSSSRWTKTHHVERTALDRQLVQHADFVHFSHGNADKRGDVSA